MDHRAHGYSLVVARLTKDGVMTRKQIESAVASGIPFTLRMADGKEYAVPHPDHISLPPNASYVIVYDDEGRFTVLPLLTMTGLESKVTESGKKDK
jgi:hypothetical protein